MLVEKIQMHPNLDRTFSFFEKIEILPISNDLSSSDLHMLLYQNEIAKNKNYIYPICKMYYSRYKSEILKLSSFSFQDNLFDFLRFMTETDVDGTYHFLETLYHKESITPKTFAILDSLLVAGSFKTFSRYSDRVHHFLNEKRKIEMKDFHNLASFITEELTSYGKKQDVFIELTEERKDYILKNSGFEKEDVYLQVLRRKAIDGKIRGSLFHYLYMMKIPFSEKELHFFLFISHMKEKRMNAFLQAFGISRKMFDEVFALSLCMNPSFQTIYEQKLHKMGSKEGALSYPSLSFMQKTKEKLAQSPNKSKVYYS